MYCCLSSLKSSHSRLEICKYMCAASAPDATPSHIVTGYEEIDVLVWNLFFFARQVVVFFGDYIIFRNWNPMFLTVTIWDAWLVLQTLFDVSNRKSVDSNAKEAAAAASITQTKSIDRSMIKHERWLCLYIAGLGHNNGRNYIRLQSVLCTLHRWL